MRYAFLLLAASVLTDPLAHAQSIRQYVHADETQTGISWASALDSFIHAQDNFLKQKTPSALSALLDAYSDDVVVDTRNGTLKEKTKLHDDYDAYLRGILDRQKIGWSYREWRRVVQVISVDEHHVIALLETVGNHYHNTVFTTRHFRYDLASIKRIGSNWKIDYEKIGAVDAEDLQSSSGGFAQTNGDRLIAMYRRGKRSGN